MMADYRAQQQPYASGDDRQPTRIKSFFRQNQNNPARKILVPLVSICLLALYFYGLLLRDVGSGVHVLRDNINSNVKEGTAPIYSTVGEGSSSSVEALLEPRSLADVTIANAEVAWKHQMDHQNYLRRKAEMKEKQWKVKEEEALRLARLQNENDTMILDADADADEINATTEQAKVILLKLPNATNMDEAERKEYVKRLTKLSSPARRTPQRRKFGKGESGGGDDLGFLPVLLLISLMTLFRVCISVAIGNAAGGIDALADSDGEDDTTNNTTTAGRSRGGLSSFMSSFGGGADAARLRRRARVARANRQFQRFVDRLNAERVANGERPISADTMRHLVNARDFSGNDYDRLSSFVEENGPAIGSIFSVIGATETEINRCPSRTLKAGDDLLRSSGSSDQRQTCSICLEQYQTGETVRTIPCFHTFHQKCIDPWLATRAECPICKHSAIG